MQQLMVALVLLSVALAATVVPLEAATVTVCATGCDSPTIAAAIAAASPGDTISVLDAFHREAFITIDKSLTIKGQGANTTVIDGGSAGATVFGVVGVTATIQDMTIQNGGASGLAIQNRPQTILTVQNVIISGLGIRNEAVLTVQNSTFRGNCGGIFGQAPNGVTSVLTLLNSTLSGCGISSDGTLVMINSTISGSPFGIINSSTATATANAMISNSTITANNVGILGFSGVIAVKNTIVGGNTLDCQQVPLPFRGSWIGHGANLTTDGSCATLAGGHFSRVTSEQLNLGPLMLNSPGSTPTYALLRGSVAIDAATDCTDLSGAPVGTDERGVGRPQGIACDVGAFELTSALPDIAVSNARPVQATFDAINQITGGIDLVLNRATAVFYTVTVTGLASSQPAVVQVQLCPVFQSCQTTNVVASATITLTNTNAAGQESAVPLGFTPSVPPGDYVLFVDVDPSGTIPVQNLNRKRTQVNVSVKATKQLVAPNVLVNGCFLTGACGVLQDPPTQVTGTTLFIRATYPVADANGFVSEIVDSIVGDANANDSGLFNDCIRIHSLGKLARPDAKRVIGIVPKGYFSFHAYDAVRNPSGDTQLCDQFGCAVGLWQPDCPNAVLVEEGSWLTTAHELGHSFGFDEEYCWLNTQGQLVTDSGTPCTHNRDGVPVSDGYWVSQSERLNNNVVQDLFDFMGAAPPGTGIDTRGSTLLPHRWIRRDHWLALLARPEFNPTDPDPPQLIVGGLLHQDGTLDLKPWHALADGVSDFPPPGPFTLLVTDPTGATLLTVPFDMSFRLHPDPLPPAQSSVSGFAFTIPYPTTAAGVSIHAPDGTLIATADPAAKVLEDAIAAVPDRCFTANPSQRREALQNKAEALQKMLNTGATKGASQKLQQDIRPHVQAWLIGGCQKASGLDVSMEDLLALIDDTILRVSGR